MEVHHHGHVHHDNIWKQYLSQFLMLFLAVFCGSMAEYYLDHNLEKEKEEQYAHSMIQDLDLDLINIKRDITETSARIKSIDSLSSDLMNPNYQNKLGDIYYRARKLSVLNYYYSMTDGTLMELKNSGNLRLIKSVAMVDSIQTYYNVYQQYSDAQEFSIKELENYRQEMMEVFDVKVFDQMIKDFPKIIRPEGNPPLFNPNPEKINSLLMHAQYCKTTSLTNLNFLIRLQNSAILLKKSIEKEYIED